MLKLLNAINKDSEVIFNRTTESRMIAKFFEQVSDLSIKVRLLTNHFQLFIKIYTIESLLKVLNQFEIPENLINFREFLTFLNNREIEKALMIESKIEYYKKNWALFLTAQRLLTEEKSRDADWIIKKIILDEFYFHVQLICYQIGDNLSISNKMIDSAFLRKKNQSRNEFVFELIPKFREALQSQNGIDKAIKLLERLYIIQDTNHLIPTNEYHNFKNRTLASISHEYFNKSNYTMALKTLLAISDEDIQVKTYINLFKNPNLYKEVFDNYEDKYSLWILCINLLEKSKVHQVKQLSIFFPSTEAFRKIPLSYYKGYSYPQL